MVADVPIAEEARQQCQSVLRKDLVNEGALPFERLHRTTARQFVIIQVAIHGLPDTSRRRSASEFWIVDSPDSTVHQE